MNKSEKITTCLITDNPVTKVLSLGQHSYADTFIAENQMHLSEPVFPLEVNLCEESGHLQLGYISNATERYNLYPYSYTSSNSKYSRDHWDEYAKTMREKWFGMHGFIAEIGSNDGYLLGQFMSDSTVVLGIDGSSEMVALSQKAGVPSMNAIFTAEVAESLLQRYKGFNLVMANNVFNHANNPVDFLKGVELMLSDDGIFVFEVPYWGDMIKSGRFVDMVYHEHPSYFTVKSVYTLVNQTGLKIIDVENVDYHGGSLRVYCKKTDKVGTPRKVYEMIDQETAMGLFDVNFYRQLENTFKHKRDQWLADFYRLKENEPDAVIIGVGAAAKANTWLNWHRLDGTLLDCITDASEFKQGKYTPLSRIPIKGDDEFANHANPYALILSWNISDNLRKALLEINPNIKFLSQ